MLTCFWHRSPSPGNLGDVLSPVILEALGCPVEWAPRREADVLACGSIIGSARPGQVVWGSGAMSMEAAPYGGVTYLAVRGPITRKIVLWHGGDCPEVYGDPALLLPEIHDAPVEKEHELGVVPHYVDLEDARERFPRAHIISPLRDDPLKVVDEIRSCRLIASSSLHGLIIAQAYGIPWAWLRLGDRLKGDGTKFRDFFASLDLPKHPRPKAGLEEAVFHLGVSPDPSRLRYALQNRLVPA